MSSARIPSSSLILTRISCVHGSAPNTPAFSDSPLRLRQPGLGQCLAEPDRVRRRAGQDLGPKIRDQGHLPRRHPAGDGNDRRAQLDRPLVDPEARR